jgi:hypothetical protein
MLTKRRARGNAGRETSGRDVRKSRKTVTGGKTLGDRHRRLIVFVVVIVVDYTPDLAFM